MNVTIRRQSSPLRGVLRGHRIAETGTRKLITLRAFGFKLSIVYGQNEPNGHTRLAKLRRGDPK